MIRSLLRLSRVLPAVLFVTPHAAATSDPAHLVGPMLQQMAAHDRGEPLRNTVDREAGY